jgi:hypothetical protein
MMEDPRSRRRVLEHIARCRAVLAERSFVVLRSPIDPRAADFAVPGFAGPEVHRYNRMHVLLYAPERSP